MDRPVSSVTGPTVRPATRRGLDESERPPTLYFTASAGTHLLPGWHLDWRPGRVYFLTLLEPSRDDRTLALTARSASRLQRYGSLKLKIN